MTDTSIPTTGLLQRHDDGDLLHAVTEAVLRTMMTQGVAGLIGTERRGRGHVRGDARQTWRINDRDRAPGPDAGRAESGWVPKLWPGSDLHGFPEPRRTPEKALVAVIQMARIGGPRYGR